MAREPPVERTPEKFTPDRIAMVASTTSVVAEPVGDVFMVGERSVA